jgi:hypothetical protein
MLIFVVILAMSILQSKRRQNAGLAAVSFRRVRDFARFEFFKNGFHLQSQNGARFFQCPGAAGLLAIDVLELELGPRLALTTAGAVDADAEDEGMNFVQCQVGSTESVRHLSRG